MTAWIAPLGVDKVGPAWVAALGEMSDVPAASTADTGTYRYNYADLGAALGPVRQILARHELAIFQVPSRVDGSIAVETTVMHSSGQSLIFQPLTIPGAASAQAAGSAITYARRYSLMAVCGLATEDDDGRQADTATHQEHQGMTGAQRRKLNATLGEIGVKSRDDRLALASGCVGRPLASSNELTVDEARRLIDALEDIGKGRAELILDANVRPIGIRRVDSAR